MIPALALAVAATFVFRRFLKPDDAQAPLKMFAVFVFAWGVLTVVFRVIGVSLVLPNPGT